MNESSAENAVTVDVATAIEQSIWRAFLFCEALDRCAFAALDPPLTTAQYHALAALARNPGLGLVELAKALLCAKSNASGIVDRIVACGFVNRDQHPSDARRVVLTLTVAGRDTLMLAERERAETLSHALSPAGDTKLATFAIRLQELTTLLEEAVSPRLSTNPYTEGAHRD